MWLGCLANQLHYAYEVAKKDSCHLCHSGDTAISVHFHSCNFPGLCIVQPSLNILRENFEKMKSFQIIDSAARLLNKNLIPQRASVTFFFIISFCNKNFCKPMMRHNSNNGVKIASFIGLFSASWSMTHVCSCPGFCYLMIDEPQI